MKHVRIYKLILVSTVSCLLISACSSNREKEQSPGHAPQKAKGKIRTDSIKEPVIVETGRPYRTQLYSPQVNYASFLSPIQNYNTEQGLALSTIACSYTDRYGNLWFGTYGGGASCYNGKNFVNYTMENGLPSNDIRSICEDKKGNLWFGTYGNGASCFDGKTFTNYDKGQGLKYPYVVGTACDKQGKMWFGGWGGLCSFDGKTFNVYDTSNTDLASLYINCLCVDKDGRIWAGLEEGGAFCYDGKKFRQYTAEADTLISNRIQSMCLDKDGNLWFGSKRNGFCIYDGKHFNNLAWGADSPNNDVRSIYSDKDGNIWLGCANGGAWVYYGGSTNNYTNFLRANGLTSVFLTTITQDHDGNMWFGSNGGGVDCYNGKALLTFSSDHGLPMDQVYACREGRDGRVWFGTHGGGLSVYDYKDFTNYGLSQGVFATSITHVYEDSKGNQWLATNGWGVIELKGDSLISYSIEQGLVGGYNSCIAEDKQGNMWFGTTNGVSKFDGSTFTNCNKEQGLAYKDVTDMLVDDKGMVWIATFGGGLSCFNGKQFINYSKKDGLPSDNIWCIVKDTQGNIWCGTDGFGLSCFNGEYFVNYTTGHGLPNNTIKDLVLDVKDKLWMGTNMGLACLDATEVKKAAAEQLAELSINIYNSQTGYPIKNIFTNAMCADSKGVIWAGTGDKLVRFDPAEAAKKNVPHIVIQSVKINRENISWNELLLDRKDQPARRDSLARLNEEISTFGKPLSEEARRTMAEQYSSINFDSVSGPYAIPTDLALPYSYNNVSFEFCAVQPSRSFLVKYQYMLEGYDDDWCPPTNKTSATFGNISEGSYNFKLKALSPGGKWSDEISYSFVVLPPWYRTWWAFILCAAAGIGSIWGLMRWRTAKLEERQRILEKTVQERTAEVVHQKEIIEEKQKEILDSIYYARRIQTSLMTQPTYIEKSLSRLKTKQ